MNNAQKIFVIVLSVISVAFFIMCIHSFISNLRKNRGKDTSRKLYIPTVQLFLSIFFIRFSLGYYSVITQRYDFLENDNLNFFEEFLNSIFHSLQVFSLDASFTKSITIGKEMFTEEYGSKLLADIFGAYNSLIYVIAPVLGGAILFGLLTRAFPYLSLTFKPYRDKYVFSELNERSISLAEDIIREALKAQKGLLPTLPLIIFTDAYGDSEDESTSELLLRAKEIGAVCIKDDIVNLRLIRTKKIYYLLMDENDNTNIHTLTSISTGKNKPWNDKCKINIYVFSQNKELGSIIKMIYAKYKSELANVVIKVVQEYTNIAYNLFNDVPLYYPLLKRNIQGSSKEKELILTIIGDSKINLEVFLGAYWCGQMLDCKLKINVITENVQRFILTVNSVNQEILQSGLFNGEADKTLLRVYPKQEIYSPAYAEFNFINADLQTGDYLEILNKRDGNAPLLIFSDYFVIDLGSDEQNMSIATELSRIIQKENLGKTAAHQNVIAYSIFDSNTKDIVNSFSIQSEDVFLYAFAAIKDIYSCKNIFMKHINEPAFSISKVHSKADMESFLKDEYNWWASIARVLHRKYKIYSVGLLSPRENPGVINKDEIEKYWEMTDSNDETCDRLTWLEHRRWNAFLRTKGFAAPSETQWNSYAYKDTANGVTHKNTNLKLHPCIIESSEKIQIENSDWDNPDYKDKTSLDYLDLVSIMVYQKQKELFGKDDKNDYKIWDTPKYDEDKP